MPNGEVVVVACASFFLAALVTDQLLRRQHAREAEARYRAKTRALAKIVQEADERLSWSATRLGEAIRAGELTSVELTLLCIDQIERTNLYTNALVATRFHEALREARCADEEKNARSAEQFPFWGVPIIAKEVFELPGMPFTAGVVSLSHRFGRETCWALVQVQRAGMIILGTGNVSEQCMWMESNNKVYGRSNCLYDASRTTGGSSGGTVCAMSALGAPIAVTSDVGGSTRIPSLFNGVFGLKPTGGTVSNQGTTPKTQNRVNWFCQLGPCARHAEDLLPLLRILAGKGGNDYEGEYPTKLKEEASAQWTADMPQRVFTCWRQFNTQGPLRLFAEKRQEEMTLAQRRLVNALDATGGGGVQTVDFPAFDRVFDIWSVLLGRETAQHPFRNVLAEGKTGRDAGTLFWATRELVKYTLTLGRFSDHTLPALMLAVLEAMEALFTGKNQALARAGEELKQELSTLLGKDGVLLVPSLPTVAPKHGSLGLLLRASESGALGLFNVMEFPALALPLGLNSEGLPMGVQIVANHGNDHLCVNMAVALERAGLAGWHAPQTLVNEL